MPGIHRPQLKPTKGMTAEKLVQQRIRSLTIRFLQTRGPLRRELAAVLGITPGDLTHRLAEEGRRQTHFKAHEVVLLASYYGVPTDAFLVSGPDRERVVEQLVRESMMDV